MATLASRDSSGTLTAQEGEQEVSRTRSFKRFRLPDAPDGRKRYRVGGSIGPVHYKADPFDPADDWNEIDLDINLTPNEAWDAAVESNGYQVHFWQVLNRPGKTHHYVAQFIRAGKWLGMAPLGILYENAAGQKQVAALTQPGITPVIDNEANHVTWPNAFGPGLHFRYNVSPDKFFKVLVIDSLASLPTPTIGANGRKLTLVMAVEWDETAPPNLQFASGITTEMGGIDAIAPDETEIDPDRYAHADSRGDVWYVQRPMAWDSPDASGETRSVPVDWRLERHGNAVMAGFSVPGTALQHASTVYPVYVDTAITEEGVAAAGDDAFVTGTNSFYSHFSGRLWIGGTSPYESWHRFTTVPIPQGATIDSATIAVNVTTARGLNLLAMDVQGQDEDDAAQIANATAFRNMALTTASVGWDVPNDGSFMISPPDIASVVQEITDRAGWASGNALGITFQHNSGTGGPQYYAYEGGAASAAKFNASYTEGSPEPTYGEIAGTSSLAMTAAAILTGIGAIAGSSTLALSASASLTAWGDVTGASTISLTTAADLTAYADVSGSSAMSLTADADLTAWGAVSGSSQMGLTTAAALTGWGNVAAASQLSMTAAADLTAWGDLSGTSDMALTTSADLTAWGSITGTSTISMTATMALDGTTTDTYAMFASSVFYSPVFGAIQ